MKAEAKIILKLNDRIRDRGITLQTLSVCTSISERELEKSLTDIKKMRLDTLCILARAVGLEVTIVERNLVPRAESGDEPIWPKSI